MNDIGESVSRSALRARGWTDAAIRKHLGAPDIETPNPHFEGGADRQGYTLTRVLAAEATAEWKAWRGKLDERRHARAPYVCPGCHAVAEPCHPGCIDAEIEERLALDEEAPMAEETLGEWLEREDVDYIP